MGAKKKKIKDRVYVLKSTKYKRKSLHSALEKDRVYFETIVNTEQWKTFERSDRIQIKKALGLVVVHENKNEDDESIVLAKELYYLGHPREYIVEQLMSQKGNSETVAKDNARAALAFIDREFEIRKQQTIDLHVLRYEKIYQQRISVDLEPLREAQSLPPHVIDNMENNHWMLAVEALQAKEKVLQMHSKKFKIKLNEYIKQKLTEKINKNYNFKALSLEQLLRLQHLIDKSTGKLQQQEVRQRQVEQEVSYEEVVEPPMAPSPLIKVTEVVPEASQPPPSTLDDIQRKLNDNLKKQFEKSLKKIKNS